MARKRPTKSASERLRDQLARTEKARARRDAAQSSLEREVRALRALLAEMGEGPPLPEVWVPGSLVRHRLFGLGRVTAARPQPDGDVVYDVTFLENGRKTLVPACAPGSLARYDPPSEQDG